MSALKAPSAGAPSSIPERQISRLALASLLCGAAAVVVGYLLLSDYRCGDFHEPLLLSYPILLLAAVGLCLLAHRAVRNAPERLSGTPFAKIGALAALAFTCGGLAYLVNEVPAKAPRSWSLNNLKQMSMAMEHYAGSHDNRLPPACSRDKDGSPLLSWRVLLLPYVEEDALYNEFHLDEPWDSPHNHALLPRMPRIYRTPADALVCNPPGTTYYQVFTGPDTPFEIAEGPRLPEDFPKGTADTILIVEAGEAVPWTKPQDVEYDPNAPLPQFGGIFGYKPHHIYIFPQDANRTLANVALADGSARTIRASVPEHAWRWAISRTTREPKPDGR